MNPINEKIGQIRELCRRSIREGGFTDDHNTELEGLCDALSGNNEADIWVPLLFKLIEAFEEDVDLTLGSPGSLFKLLEKTAPIYEKHLQDSLIRKPTNIACWMVERITRSPGKDKEYWLAKIESVGSHPNISAQLRNDLEIDGKI